MRDFELKEEVLTILKRIMKALERIAASHPEIPKKQKGDSQE